MRKNKLESSPFFMFIILRLNDEVGFEGKKINYVIIEKKTLKILKTCFGRGVGVCGQLFADFDCLEPNPGERKQGRILLI